MGRCSGCSGDRCSCIIKAGSGVSITGAGTQANPYVVESSGGGGGGGGGFVPGMVMAYGGEVAPPGWLLCNGQAVSRTAYSSLFSAIGIKYGDGGPAGTHFNVPDLAGRFPLGADASHPLGSSTENGTIDRGSETYTLTMGNVPAHTHTLPAHTHDISHGHTGSAGATNTDHGHHFVVGGGGHEHYYSIRGGSEARGTGNSTASSYSLVGTTTTGGGGHVHEGDTWGMNQNVAHSHSISVSTHYGQSGSGGSGNSGSAGQANPVPVKTMPPWTGVTYIIKT